MKHLLSLLREIYHLSKVMRFRYAVSFLYQTKIVKKKMIKCHYLDHIFYLVNEKDVTYYLTNSVSKMSNLVENIPGESIDTVFDLGANCGIFSYFVKKRYPSSTVYLFEPSADLIACIKANLRGFSGINIVPKAVYSKANETVPFYVNTSSQQTNSIHRENVEIFCSDQDFKVLDVETESLDNFCKNNNIAKIDVLKVDLQGAENQLINGGKSMLRKVALAFFEISFLDSEIFETIRLLCDNFSRYKVVNAVLMGADIMFTNNVVLGDYYCSPSHESSVPLDAT